MYMAAEKKIYAHSFKPIKLYFIFKKELPNEPEIGLISPTKTIFYSKRAVRLYTASACMEPVQSRGK